MAILWCGGEDIDFPSLGPINMDPTAGRFRAGYARASLNIFGGTNGVTSNPFPGGSITNGWWTFRYYKGDTFGVIPSSWIAGLVDSSGKGIGIGYASGSRDKAILFKTDGTLLLAESGDSIAQKTLHKIDVQITDFGANANIKVYINNSVNPIIDFTGNCIPSGCTNFDRVILWVNDLYDPWKNSTSEHIVADEDTRVMSLVTLAPNLAGDLNQWTGAYTAIDETTNSDADIIYADANDEDFQCNLIGLPSGTFVVKAIKISARAVRAATGIQKVKLGVKTNSAVDVDAAHTLSVAWTTQERLMTQNPVTVNNWTSDEMGVLQLNLRAAT